MTERPRALSLGLVLGATWLATGVARAQILPEEPVQLADGRVVLSGRVAASMSSSHDDGYFNDTEYGRDALRVLRLALSGEAEVNAHIGVLGEVQTDNFKTLRPFAFYARVRPDPDFPLDVQIGRLPPTFGAYGRRGYGSDDPLIGYPLMYHYATTLRSDAIPGTADDLLGVRGRGFRVRFPIGVQGVGRGLPIASALSWDTGVQLRLGERPLSLTVSVTQGTLSNPRVDEDNGGKQLAARLTVQPNAGLVIGFSFATGEYLANAAHAGLEGRSNEAPSQNAVGVDLEYSSGVWLVRTEAILSSWDAPVVGAPFVDAPLRARSLLLEGRYRVRADFYLAGRYDYLGFSRIAGTLFDGSPTTWDAPVSRVEAGGGYYLLRNVALKITYQHNWRDGGPEKWTPKPGQRLKWNLHRVSGRRAEAGCAEVHHIWRPPTK